MYFSQVLSNTLAQPILWQTDTDFGITSFLYNYFFDGIGYWFYFLVLALIAMLWVFYDSSRRNFAATGWRIGVLIAVGLLLPSIFFKFSSTESDVIGYYTIKDQIRYLERYQEPDNWRHTVDDLETELRMYPPLTGTFEPIIYFGVLGGLGGPLLAVAYFLNYQGQSSSSQQERVYVPPPPPDPPRPPSSSGRERVTPPPPRKPKAHAWLVTAQGRSHQLNQGTTALGRSAQNDIQITNDPTVSKGHAKIVEQNNHFRFFDLGSTNGSRVNDRPVRQPILLAPDDQIQLGDNTMLRFVTSQR